MKTHRNSPVSGVKLLLAVLALAPMPGESAGDPETTATATRVLVEPVKWSDAPVPVQASGTIRRKVEADLSFKVGGMIAEIAVRPGDAVRKGQRLATLRLDEIDSRVQQASARHAQAQRELARMESLLASKAVSIEAKETAATSVLLAAAALRAAEFDRRFAVIEAPADGRILQRLLEPEEMVAPGQTVLSFASEQEGWLVTVHLAARDASRVRAGDRAEARLSGFGLAPVDGVVTQIAESADPATRTVATEIRLAKVPDGARSGFVANVIIRPAPVPSRPEVPLSSLVEGDGMKASVFLVDRDTRRARREQVEIETLATATAFLRSPLEKGIWLVVAGAEFLRDGAPVLAGQLQPPSAAE